LATLNPRAAALWRKAASATSPRRLRLSWGLVETSPGFTEFSLGSRGWAALLWRS